MYSDYNYEMNPASQTCSLVEGLKPIDHKEVCAANKDMKVFYSPTGYRRIPLTKCERGRELDKGEEFPCPGFEVDFEKKHSISGAGLFFAIVIPISLAAGVGWWVWRNYGYQVPGFGAIRLGDGPANIASGGSKVGEYLISVPVVIIAGTWAVAKATPLLVMSLYRSARGYFPVSGGGSSGGWAGQNAPYRSRDAFANRRGDYVGAATDDEDELLGDDLEGEGEEV